MSNRYEGLAGKEADDVLLGIIDTLVSDAMDEARAMTRKEWEERDESYLSHYFASAIYYAVQNRRMGAP